MIIVERDAFEEWKAHPITEALMRGLVLAEREIEKTWINLTLEGGECDPVTLAKLRERRFVYREIRELDHLRIEELNNEQST